MRSHAGHGTERKLQVGDLPVSATKSCWVVGDRPSSVSGTTRSTDAEFTAVFRKVPEGDIGFVEELPGANTQGATLDEARRNLAEATQLVLEANRELTEHDIAGQDVIRVPLKIPTA